MQCFNFRVSIIGVKGSRIQDPKPSVVRPAHVCRWLDRLSDRVAKHGVARQAGSVERLTAVPADEAQVASAARDEQRSGLCGNASHGGGRHSSDAWGQCGLCDAPQGFALGLAVLDACGGAASEMNTGRMSGNPATVSSLSLPPQLQPLPATGVYRSYGFRVSLQFK